MVVPEAGKIFARAGGRDYFRPGCKVEMFPNNRLFGNLPG
jgi:hypothetical protein